MENFLPSKLIIINERFLQKKHQSQTYDPYFKRLNDAASF